MSGKSLVGFVRRNHKARRVVLLVLLLAEVVVLAVAAAAVLVVLAVAAAAVLWALAALAVPVGWVARVCGRQFFVAPVQVATSSDIDSLLARLGCKHPWLQAAASEALKTGAAGHYDQ
jgi:hypothetical protein